MKILILAGGLGTRISEETENKPKPMVLINGVPIIWHLMNIFAYQGYKDFVIATGYKGDVINDWVSDQNIFNKKNGWSVKVIDTGMDTQTGGRISMCMKEFPKDTFIATYGDGLANVSINSLLNFHNSYSKLSTVTAVRPPARFGVLNIKNGLVNKFAEKNQTDTGWINGGFFVLEPMVKEYIWSELEPFESGALPRLVAENQLAAYQHSGFWKPMDTLREKIELENMAKLKSIPWLHNI